MITLGSLASCKPGELVKVKANDRTEWAIVAAQARGNEYPPLIFLTGANAPLLRNIDSKDPSDFKTVAKFGTKRRVELDLNGQCQIGNDKLSKTAGSLVITEDGNWRLVVNKYQQAALRWFDLRSGGELGDTEVARIAFGKWTLFLEGGEREPEIKILSYPVQ